MLGHQGKYHPWCWAASPKAHKLTKGRKDQQLLLQEGKSRETACQQVQCHAVCL